MVRPDLRNIDKQIHYTAFNTYFKPQNEICRLLFLANGMITTGRQRNELANMAIGRITASLFCPPAK